MLKCFCSSLDKITIFRKLEDFRNHGKVADDVAQVRFEYFMNKRKARLMALNQYLINETNVGGR